MDKPAPTWKDPSFCIVILMRQDPQSLDEKLRHKKRNGKRTEKENTASSNTPELTARPVGRIP